MIQDSDIIDRQPIAVKPNNCEEPPRSPQVSVQDWVHDLPRRCALFAIGRSTASRTSPRGIDHVNGRTFESLYQSEYIFELAPACVPTGDQDLAEGVTYNTFVAAYDLWGDLERPAAWIRRVVSDEPRAYARIVLEALTDHAPHLMEQEPAIQLVPRHHCQGRKKVRVG